MPYEENGEDFGRWFREAAKEKWEDYLNNDFKNVSTEEFDAMRKFLIEQGTEEEINTKLDSELDRNTLAFGALLADIKSHRPDFKRRKSW